MDIQKGITIIKSKIFLMMFKGKLSYILRSINSRITSTHPGLVRKIIKVNILLSAFIAGKAKQKDKMIVNPSRSMGRSLYWTGFHDVKELIFLHHFLKSDMVFLDIGANQGEYTLFAAKRLNNGQVISFEPLPAMIKALEKNITINDFNNVIINSYGLSNVKGEFPIFDVDNGNEGLATFYKDTLEESKTQCYAELKVLDEEFPKMNLNRLDFIKLDIEGGELFALKGSRETLLKYKPNVLIEINDETYKIAGYNSSDVLTFFRTINYAPFTLTKEATLDACKELPAFGNVIFKPL
jgi:FkbM family methyltransferase